MASDEGRTSGTIFAKAWTYNKVIFQVLTFQTESRMLFHISKSTSSVSCSGFITGLDIRLSNGIVILLCRLRPFLIPGRLTTRDANLIRSALLSRIVAGRSFLRLAI